MNPGPGRHQGAPRFTGWNSRRRAKSRLRLRLATRDTCRGSCLGGEFDRIFGERSREADEFYAERICLAALTAEERAVMRQAYAGLLWSKQFYHYIVRGLAGGGSRSSPRRPPAALRPQRRMACTSTTAT